MVLPKNEPITVGAIHESTEKTMPEKSLKQGNVGELSIIQAERHIFSLAVLLFRFLFVTIRKG